MRNKLLIALTLLLALGCGQRKKAVESNNRGFALLAQKRYADAIAEFQRGISHDDKLPELHLGLGRAHEETQQYPKAEEAFRKYTQLRPADQDGHYYLGLVLEAQVRTRDAAESFRRAATSAGRGRTHLAWFRLGRALVRLGEPNEAAEAFRQSAKADPTFVRAYEELGLLYADHGDFGSAEQALQNAVATGVRDAHVRSSLGLVYSKMADRVRAEDMRNRLLEKAAGEFLEATKIQATYARAYWNLGMTLAKITKDGSPSRRTEAVKYLQTFLSRHGKDDELSSKANDMISRLSQ
jgi:tetratricopeptide (TPR) repeat protein